MYVGRKRGSATGAVGDGTFVVRKYVISQSSRIDFVWTSSNGYDVRDRILLDRGHQSKKTGVSSLREVRKI